MRHDFDNVPSRQLPGILNKWTVHPKGVLPLWVADMDFPVAPQIRAALQKQIRHGVLGYELLSPLLCETIAARMQKLYNWEVDPRSIVYTAGVNNGYNIAARIVCSSKRGYLIQPPVFNEFYDTAHKTGFRRQSARLQQKVEANSIHYEVDWEAFEKGVKKSGMFLLCHPHNPVGKIFSPAELHHLAEICLANDVTIVSDEIHAEVLLGGAAFTPLASLSAETAQHTITLISASKAFNVPGLSCAFAIIPNETLRQRFFAVAQGMSVEISTPGLVAAQVAFSGQADAWLKSLRRYLTENRDFVVDYLAVHLPEIRTTHPDATYLLWLDCSGLKLGMSPFEFFLQKAKVALSDGSHFGAGYEQFVRLNMGTTRKVLTEALQRIRTSIHQRKS